MLILRRRAGQSIHLGDDIRIRVIEIEGASVRLGFEAPRSLRIDREEVRLRIELEQVELERIQGERMQGSKPAVGSRLPLPSA